MCLTRALSMLGFVPTLLHLLLLHFLLLLLRLVNMTALLIHPSLAIKRFHVQVQSRFLRRLPAFLPVKIPA